MSLHTILNSLPSLLSYSAQTEYVRLAARMVYGLAVQNPPGFLSAAEEDIVMSKVVGGLNFFSDAEIFELSKHVSSSKFYQYFFRVPQDATVELNLAQRWDAFIELHGFDMGLVHGLLNSAAGIMSDPSLSQHRMMLQAQAYEYAAGKSVSSLKSLPQIPHVYPLLSDFVVKHLVTKAVPIHKLDQLAHCANIDPQWLYQRLRSSNQFIDVSLLFTFAPVLRHLPVNKRRKLLFSVPRPYTRQADVLVQEFMKTDVDIFSLLAQLQPAHVPGFFVELVVEHLQSHPGDAARIFSIDALVATDDLRGMLFETYASMGDEVFSPSAPGFGSPGWEDYRFLLLMDKNIAAAKSTICYPSQVKPHRITEEMRMCLLLLPLSEVFNPDVVKPVKRSMLRPRRVKFTSERLASLVSALVFDRCQDAQIALLAFSWAPSWTGTLDQLYDLVLQSHITDRT